MKKTVWILLGSGIILLSLWGAYLAGGSGTAPTSLRPEAAATKEAAAPVKKKLIGEGLPTGDRKPLSPSEQEAAIAEGETISDLFDAAIEGTPEKTEAVYAALAHPNDAVREGALDAIIQHMGRESIPRLRAALAAARTPEERTRLEEAIEFIELPTMSELRAKAGGAPRRPRSPTATPNTTPPPATVTE